MHFGSHDRSLECRRHVTVLYPFAPEDELDEIALAALFASFASFSFVLDRVERFADGMPWLHPEPPEPLRALIDAVVAAVAGPPAVRGNDRRSAP